MQGSSTRAARVSCPSGVASKCLSRALRIDSRANDSTYAESHPCAGLPSHNSQERVVQQVAQHL